MKPARKFTTPQPTMQVYVPPDMSAEAVDALFTDPVNNAKVKALLGIRPRTSKVYEAETPFHLVSLANMRGHWRKIHALKQVQKSMTLGLVLRALKSTLVIRKMSKSGDTIHVHFVRVGPKRLDSDNAISCWKEIRDSIATLFGIDDGSDRWRWTYAQRKGRHAVEIRIWTEAP